MEDFDLVMNEQINKATARLREMNEKEIAKRQRDEAFRALPLAQRLPRETGRLLLAGLMGIASMALLALPVLLWAWLCSASVALMQPWLPSWLSLSIAGTFWAGGIAGVACALIKGE